MIGREAGVAVAGSSIVLGVVCGVVVGVAVEAVNLNGPKPTSSSLKPREPKTKTAAAPMIIPKPNKVMVSDFFESSTSNFSVSPTAFAL